MLPNALPAADFQLRAAKDVYLDLGSGLNLTGFVGGVTGFESARNVTLDIAGELVVSSGIVAANADTGVLTVRASEISTDGASVFIAHNLVVAAESNVQLNTLIDRITIDTTAAGTVLVNEATGLTVDHVVAAAGSISINAGDDTGCATSATSPRATPSRSRPRATSTSTTSRPARPSARRRRRAATSPWTPRA
ncbi:hypothetical protein HK414_15985 [Ramlibacter terrae]|uniref:Uncharacterized protein n=1 Tax=Ramlibacter terrae TaxID=2732511 RepID=A0ABX6P3F0_9BURK|nr:hypothetical protein HK414_15985 [Ramlibacter terrae]